MNGHLLEKIRKAEKMRKKPKFPASLFSGADYIESASLFREIANECTTVEEKVKYIQEAANTYLMDNTEYSQYYAYECYKNIFEILKDEKIEISIDYYLKGVECLLKTDKKFLAGAEYKKAGDIIEKENPKKALEAYENAYKMFIQDSNSQFHTKSTLEKIFSILLDRGDLNEAINKLEDIEKLYLSLNRREIKHIKLCKQLLMMLAGKTEFEEALEKKEAELFMKILNSDKQAGRDLIVEFKNSNTCESLVTKILDFVIKQMNPENDIC